MHYRRESGHLHGTLSRGTLPAYKPGIRTSRLFRGISPGGTQDRRRVAADSLYQQQARHETGLLPLCLREQQLRHYRDQRDSRRFDQKHSPDRIPLPGHCRHEIGENGGRGDPEIECQRLFRRDVQR